MYDGKKVYGPYYRKDGRQVVILKTPGSINDTQTVSYPKYLVECALKRYLDPDETIDHIDGDFLNNDFNNLRIVNRKVHCKSHVDVRHPVTIRCIICGAEVETIDPGRKTCGSKSCAGKCTHLDGYNKGNHVVANYQVPLHSVRNSIDDVPTVQQLLDSMNSFAHI